jgi:phospho-N-acetylmuramoyl-pentapeptide-transferase
MTTIYNIVKLFGLTALSSIIAIIIAHFLIPYLNKVQFWKKQARQKTIDGKEAEVFRELHKDKETKTPRGGGVVIWASVLIVAALMAILSSISSIWWMDGLNFITRTETWLPFFALIIASIIGLADDMSVVWGKGKYVGGGLKFSLRLFFVCAIGLIGGLWFALKLGWTTVHIPLLFNFPEGINFDLGIIGFIIFFIIICLASWASGVVDGIDGLSGGVFASIFTAFTIIAFVQGDYNLATFCAIIVGTLFSFLWFNIPPAKFYMGETGILGLTMAMAIVAFLTNSVIVLPIIAGVLVIETGSVIIQLLSKKFRHKKIWKSTPIHHHLEAIGWTQPQITMRLWLLGIVFALIGVAIQLLWY